jgi:NADPH:quinone reductase
MRAVVVTELAGPEAATLTEVPAPEGCHERSPGERMLIEVHAAAICFPDLLQTRGLYQDRAEPPYICGSEAGGVVLEAPAGSGFLPGDRVAGLVRPGAMADLALAPPKYMVHLPDTMSFAEGAALWLNYATAWFALHRGGAQAGETVLIQGAAGGVGTAAIEVAREFSLKTLAVVSSDAKEAAVRQMGADVAVRTGGGWLDEVRELTGGRGVQIVIDTVGGDRFLDSVRSLEIGGRLVVVGFAAGAIPEIKVNRLLLRNLTLTGIALDVFDDAHPGMIRRVNDALEALMSAGRLKPLIGARLPLAEGAEALRTMERREAIGKIVVDVRDGDQSDCH